MSYILEALKKAQAERQLGDLPSIHAPAIAAVPAAAAGLRNKPLALALGALGIVTAGLLALVLRPVAAPAVVQTPAAAAPRPVSQTQTSAMPLPAPQALASPPAVPQAQALVAPPAQARPADAPPFMVQGQTAPAAAQRRNAAASAVTASAAVPEAAARGTAAATASAASVAAAPAQDDTTQTLRDLPEPIQRAIPAITVGGYIYSRNPADRLLLIDKVLRHEGEEVAPGLVLDKLLPKAAVFTFRGYRYRVPY
jgi:general secretion pathway protein B